MGRSNHFPSWERLILVRYIIKKIEWLRLFTFKLFLTFCFFDILQKFGPHVAYGKCYFIYWVLYTILGRQNELSYSHHPHLPTTFWPPQSPLSHTTFQPPPSPSSLAKFPIATVAVLCRELFGRHKNQWNEQFTFNSKFITGNWKHVEII